MVAFEGSQVIVATLKDDLSRFFWVLMFQGGSRPYFNSVESTTSYHKLPTPNPAIEADQVTAVYLSPQDPDYFTAGSHPVALYRYRLEFFPLSKPKAYK